MTKFVIEEPNPDLRKVDDLRAKAFQLRETMPNTSQLYLAAADLLEAHNRTSISLENFGHVGKFVNSMLAKIEESPYIPNGV